MLALLLQTVGMREAKKKVSREAPCPSIYSLRICLAFSVCYVCLSSLLSLPHCVSLSLSVPVYQSVYIFLCVWRTKLQRGQQNLRGCFLIVHTCHGRKYFCINCLLSSEADLFIPVDENSTLTSKKSKINIQMCRIFPKLGFMHYSIWSGNSSTYFKPFASSVKFSWMLLWQGRERGRRRAHTHIHTHTHTYTCVHTHTQMRVHKHARPHAHRLANRNLKLAMQFTVQGEIVGGECLEGEMVG